jgi:DNA-binding MarR family transcriptional regulator
MARSDSPFDPVAAGPVVCTCAALRRLSRRVSAIYDRHLAPSGLTTNQYSLLMTLAAGPLALGVLARRAATDRTTLTRNLAPLARAGWVAVAPGRDGRQRVAGLTAAGVARVAMARSSWAEAQGQIEAVLGRATVAELHGLISGAMARLRPLVVEN